MDYRLVFVCGPLYHVGRWEQGVAMTSEEQSLDELVVGPNVDREGFSALLEFGAVLFCLFYAFASSEALSSFKSGGGQLAFLDWFPNWGARLIMFSVAAWFSISLWVDRYSLIASTVLFRVNSEGVFDRDNEFYKWSSLSSIQRSQFGRIRFEVGGPSPRFIFNKGPTNPPAEEIVAYIKKHAPASLTEDL